MIFSSRLIRLKHLPPPFVCRRAHSVAATKSCDPLRILFCGSDEFSIKHLHALNDERLERPQTGIESIDVVCRPGKWTGRGLKTKAHPPVRAAAHDLGLKLHEIDEFSPEWTPPEHINLIIAVSFGLLIPPGIIKQVKYRGLNVHPSMLPDLRGAAPLQHALLQQRSHSGVSVQTLHPTKFDRGATLAQTPLPGVPISTIRNSKQLEDLLAPLGVELLLQTIRERRFIEPVERIRHTQQDIDQITDGKGPSLARKITPSDRNIDWAKDLSNEKILLRDRVLGSLWDNDLYQEFGGRYKHKSQGIKRVVYGPWTTGKALPANSSLTRIGESPFCVAVNVGPESDGALIHKGKGARILKIDERYAEDDPRRVISCSSFTIDGKGKGTGGLAFAEMLRLRQSRENQAARRTLKCNSEKPPGQEQGAAT